MTATELLAFAWAKAIAILVLPKVPRQLASYRQYCNTCTLYCKYAVGLGCGRFLLGYYTIISYQESASWFVFKLFQNFHPRHPCIIPRTRYTCTRQHATDATGTGIAVIAVQGTSTQCPSARVLYSSTVPEHVYARVHVHVYVHVCCNTRVHVPRYQYPLQYIHATIAIAGVAMDRASWSPRLLHEQSPGYRYYITSRSTQGQCHMEW